MNPIVNPLFFYFAMVADALGFLFGIIGFLSICVVITFAVILCCMYNDGDIDEDFYFLSKKIYYHVSLTEISTQTQLDRKYSQSIVFAYLNN